MKSKIRGLNEKYEAKHGGKDHDTNSIFSLIAKKGMERKEKVKLMYSCQNGITDKSFNKLAGSYRQDPTDIAQPQFRQNRSTLMREDNDYGLLLPQLGGSPSPVRHSIFVKPDLDSPGEDQIIKKK